MVADGKEHVLLIKTLFMIIVWFLILFVFYSLLFCCVFLIFYFDFEPILITLIIIVCTDDDDDGDDNVLSSPECPISGSGAGPAPSALTAWTLISNGVYVPVLLTKNGGDCTSAEFQCTLVPAASRHDTLYRKPWPL